MSSLYREEYLYIKERAPNSFLIENIERLVRESNELLSPKEIFCVYDNHSRFDHGLEFGNVDMYKIRYTIFPKDKGFSSTFIYNMPKFKNREPEVYPDNRLIGLCPSCFEEAKTEAREHKKKVKAAGRGFISIINAIQTLKLERKNAKERNNDK